jgi:broad specificity phosphatase PhoE
VATTILLARHGETDWNLEGRFQGQLDPPLNETGRRQATALADALAGDGVAAVYSSDLRRAAETAAIVAARLSLPVTPDRRLREIDVGAWSGLTRAEVEERFPASYAHWLEGELAGHDGESREQLAARVHEAVISIAAAHPAESVLVVTHGGAVRALQRRALGEPLPLLRNCGVSRLRFQDAGFAAID